MMRDPNTEIWVDPETGIWYQQEIQEQ